MIGKNDIRLDDFRRILVGEVPAEFYIETVIRALLVYILLVAGMRLMGKRINAELNRTELAAISTLAASTGLILLSPDRGLLPAVVAIGVLLFIKRMVNHQTFLHKKAEDIAEGSLGILIKSGVIQIKELKKTGLTREQLFAQLRGMGVMHLGNVFRLYFEANGDFSLLKEEKESSGLSVIPDWDQEFLNEQEMAGTQVCSRCGSGGQGTHKECPNCGNDGWKEAVKGTM